MSVVADNERYKLTDWTYEGLTVSKTELKKGQSTRGHKHPNPEIYYFLDDCILEIGTAGSKVRAGNVVIIAPNQFHRVRTIGQSTAAFLSFFAAPRSGDYEKVS